MGRRFEDLPEPSDLLDSLQKKEVLRDKDGEVIETVGPQIRFAGHECFATDAALKAIKKAHPSEPRHPKPRDLFIRTGQEENILPGKAGTIPGEFYGDEVVVKYFARGTGAPIKLKKNKEGDVVSGKRVKEFDVYPQEYLLTKVTGDRA